MEDSAGSNAPGARPLSVTIGTAAPESEATVTAESSHVPRLTAAIMPSGSARTTATAMPAKASSTVCGMTAAMRAATLGRVVGLGH